MEWYVGIREGHISAQATEQQKIQPTELARHHPINLILKVSKASLIPSNIPLQMLNQIAAASLYFILCTALRTLLSYFNIQQYLFQVLVLI